MLGKSHYVTLAHLLLIKLNKEKTAKNKSAWFSAVWQSGSQTHDFAPPSHGGLAFIGPRGIEPNKNVRSGRNSIQKITAKFKCFEIKYFRKGTNAKFATLVQPREWIKEGEPGDADAGFTLDLG